MIGRHVVRKDPPFLVGSIDDVICDIEAKFNDGSICLLPKVSTGLIDFSSRVLTSHSQATTEKVKIVEDDVSEDEVEPERNYLFYPSQQVAASASVWEDGTWSVRNKPKENNQQRKKKDKHRIHGTFPVFQFSFSICHFPAHILQVFPRELEVFWHNQAKGAKKFPDTCSIADVILLSHFKHTKFEVGDLAMIHPDIRAYFLRLQQALQPEVAPSPGKKKQGGKNAKKVSLYCGFFVLLDSNSSHSQGNQNKAAQQEQQAAEKTVQSPEAKSHPLSTVLNDNELHQSFQEKMSGDSIHFVDLFFFLSFLFSRSGLIG
jgi:hypothetical protein